MIQITPDPDEAERRAILAALAAEEAERAGSDGTAMPLPAHDESEP